MNPAKKKFWSRLKIKVSLQFRARSTLFLPFYYARRVFFPVTAHLNFPATAVNHSFTLGPDHPSKRSSVRDKKKFKMAAFRRAKASGLKMAAHFPLG